MQMHHIRDLGEALSFPICTVIHDRSGVLWNPRVMDAWKEGVQKQWKWLKEMENG